MRGGSELMISRHHCCKVLGIVAGADTLEALLEEMSSSTQLITFTDYRFIAIQQVYYCKVLC